MSFWFRGERELSNIGVLLGVVVVLMFVRILSIRYHPPDDNVPPSSEKLIDN